MEAREQEYNDKEEQNKQNAIEKKQPEAVEFSHLDKATAESEHSRDSDDPPIAGEVLFPRSLI
jgi:hypothetical protein